MRYRKDLLWFRPDGGKSAREIGREHAELLVRGLLAGPPETPFAVRKDHRR